MEGLAEPLEQGGLAELANPGVAEEHLDELDEMGFGFEGVDLFGKMVEPVEGAGRGDDEVTGLGDVAG